MSRTEAAYLTKTAGVDAFIAAVDNPARREDALATLSLYKDVTSIEPVMWGDSLIGFGDSIFTYPNGTRSPVPAACFSPRKAGMALYLGSTFGGAASLYAKLGKYKKGVSCVTVNKLADIDLAVLREIVARSFAVSLERAKQ